MIAIGEDELTCDLAETYGVFNMRAMPASTVAVLADGLKPDSRIKSKISGSDISMDTMLYARILDMLSLLVWFQTKDGAKNKNRPASVLDALLNREKQEQKEFETFQTPESFMDAWKTGGGG